MLMQANERKTVYYAVVGDNGMGVLVSDCAVIEALHNLVQCTVATFPTREMAFGYAMAAYTNRYVFRNYTRGLMPRVPYATTLPLDEIYYEQEYAEREGKLPVQGYFPGIPV